MEVPHWLDPGRAPIQTAAAAGSFITLLVTREYSWAAAFSLFVVGQMLAYWFAVPIAQHFGLTADLYPCVGLGIGLLGMFAIGGVVVIFKRFANDPMGTLISFWALWRQGGSRGSKEGE